MTRSLLITFVAAASLLAFTAGEAGAIVAAGTTPGGDLVIYDIAAPGTIIERHAITGLVPGERIDGLDVRPATGEVYAYGVKPGEPDREALSEAADRATLRHAYPRVLVDAMSPDPKEFVQDAAVERLKGDKPGRIRALIAAFLAGVAAAALAYRFLRSEPGPVYDY